MLRISSLLFALLLVAALAACEGPERRIEDEPRLVHAKDREEPRASEQFVAPAEAKPRAALVSDPRLVAMEDWPPWDAMNADPPAEVLGECRSLQQQALAPGGRELCEKLCDRLRQLDAKRGPYIAWILAPVPGSEVFSRLAQAVENSALAGLQRAAARALGQRSELEAGLSLLSALLNEATAQAASQSAMSLARLDAQRTGVEESLLKALASAELEKGARPFVLDAVVELRVTSAAALIGRNLEKQSLGEALMSIHALSQLGGSFSLETLRNSCRHSEPDIRASSLRALAELGDSLSRDSFREACQDPALAVRIAAIAALAKIKDRGAAGEVSRALNDSELELRLVACRAAGALELVSCADRLTELCEGEQPLAQRCQALDALSEMKLGHREGLAFLREACASEDSDRLRFAAAALRASLATRRQGAAAITEVLNSCPPELSEALWEVALMSLRSRRDWREEERNLVDNALRRAPHWTGRQDLKLRALLLGREAQVGVSSAELVRAGDELMARLKGRDEAAFLESSRALRVLGGELVWEELELARRAGDPRKTQAAVEAVDQWWSWQRQRLLEEP